MPLLDRFGSDKLLEHASELTLEFPPHALPRHPSQGRKILAPRAARLLRIPRPRYPARNARQNRRARDPRATGQGAARRVAPARLPRAVRLRAEGLGRIRV